MKRAIRGLSLAAAVMLGQAAAQTTNPPAQPPDWQTPTGPYAVVMEEDPGLPDHTIYRPVDVAAAAKAGKLPLVAFAGPGCDANGTAFRPFFTEVASHGFLLIASGLPEPKGGSGPDFPKTKPEDLTASIDWAIAENGRAGSKYLGRLDPAKVAVMGQSCGGAQALVVSKDPRIKTVVMWNSCSFQFIRGGRPPGAPPAGAAPAGGPPAGTRPAGAPPAGGPPRGPGPGARIPVPNVTPETLTNLRLPIAYFMGGKRDMLYQAAVGDVDRYENAPLFWASIDLPNDAHAGSFRAKNGGVFGVAGVAWLKWQLNGDAAAAKMFTGAECGLCKDSRWEIRRKKIE